MLSGDNVMQHLSRLFDGAPLTLSVSGEDEVSYPASHRDVHVSPSLPLSLSLSLSLSPVGAFCLTSISSFFTNCKNTSHCLSIESYSIHCIDTCYHHLYPPMHTSLHWTLFVLSSPLPNWICPALYVYYAIVSILTMVKYASLLAVG